MRGSKSGVRLDRQAQGPPRTARHSRQTDCQPAPRVVVPADKRKQLPNSSGFRRPATRCRWLYQSCLMLFEMPRGWGQCRQSPRRFWHCGIAREVARALCYGKTGTSGTESSEPSAKDAECGKCDSIRRAVPRDTGNRTRVAMRSIDGASAPGVLRASLPGEVQITASPCYPCLI